MESIAPGFHDAILLCVGVAVVYLVVASLQLLQLRSRRLAPAVASPAREPSVASKLPLDAESQNTSNTSFASQLTQRTVEIELKRQRLELERLRADLQATQSELKLLRSERKIGNVAPLYNEAMDFARRGVDAAAIATRCGISRGEAELVAALARNTTDKDRLPAFSKDLVSDETNERARYRTAA
jgi:Protein of unknown function (DUF2802)